MQVNAIVPFICLAFYWLSRLRSPDSVRSGCSIKLSGTLKSLQFILEKAHRTVRKNVSLWWSHIIPVWSRAATPWRLLSYGVYRLVFW